MRRRPERRWSIAIGTFGLAGTVVALPLTMGDKWAPGVVWALFGLAAAIAAAGIVALLRPRKPDRPGAEQDQRNVAEEMRAVAADLKLFLDEQMRMAPFDTPTGLRGRQANRMREWERALVARYRDDYRSMVLEVIDEAIQHKALPRSSRTTAAGGSLAQVRLVPGLLERAAGRLEKLANGSY